MFVNSDFSDLLRIFNANNVKYLVIGGYMGVPPVRADVLMGIPGVQFEECWSRRVEADFDSLKVNFISKADLIAAKRASGRPQDLIDADLLSQS